MNTTQDKAPLNDKGQAHGYWEIYNNGSLWYVSNYINGEWHGYFEYRRFGKITKKYAAK